jgi:integrase
MTKQALPFGIMSLYTRVGERKYLNGDERRRFFAALPGIESPAERSFCEMIYWTGCRPSEALALCAINIDFAERMVVIRSLKKRGAKKGRHFRPVPVPLEFLTRLDSIHGLSEAQQTDDYGAECRLWTFGRTKGWKLVRRVMDEAGLSGAKASARGLRHTMGVHAIGTDVPEARLKKWLGHSDLETTAIYLDAVGPEDRAIAERMWG